MTDLGLIGMVSIFTAGITIAIGSVGPAFGEAKAVAQALSSIAQQPDEAPTRRLAAAPDAVPAVWPGPAWLPEVGR